MKRTTALIAVLVALCGISVFLWTAMEREEVDKSVSGQIEAFACASCGHSFQVTVQEASDMFRAGNGVVCPACKQGGATKQNVIVDMGQGGVKPPQEPTAGEYQKPEKKAAPMGMTRPQD